jgi:hypothetical protein
MRLRPVTTTLVLCLALMLGAAACGGSADEPGSATASTPSGITGMSGATHGGTATGQSAGPRPSSTATLAIASPTNGQVVKGDTVDLVVDLKGAELVTTTSTDLQPDEGHLHVLLDDQLVSMTGSLDQPLTALTPGEHLVKVEFVANDHAPFDPRVIAAVAFEVKG